MCFYRKSKFEFLVSTTFTSLWVINCKIDLGGGNAIPGNSDGVSNLIANSTAICKYFLEKYLPTAVPHTVKKEYVGQLDSKLFWVFFKLVTQLVTVHINEMVR